MRYTLARFGRIMLERWHAAPMVGDFPAILDAFAIARKELGESLVVIEVVSAGGSLPTAQAVREAIRCVRRLRHLRSMHLVVVEGDSVRRALIRGVFNPIAFVLGEGVEMCSDVDEAIARACEVTGQDPTALLQEIGAVGLLEAAGAALP